MPTAMSTLALLAAVLAGLAVRPPESTAAEPSQRIEVFLGITGQLRSTFTTRVADSGRAPGGLAHLAPLIQRLRSAHPGLILVDTGNALAPAPDLPRVLRRQGQPWLAALQELRYEALVPGERDLREAPALLGEAQRTPGLPWVAANLEPLAGTAAIPAVRRVEREGVRVALVGLAPSGAAGAAEEAAGLRTGDAEAAARDTAARLRREDRADLIVALDAGGTGTERDRQTALLLGTPPSRIADRLADTVPELDLVIAGRGRPPRRGVAPRPNRSYRVPLVEAVPGARGLTVLRLTAERTDGRWKVTEVGQETLWAGEERDEGVLRRAGDALAEQAAWLREPLPVYLGKRPSRRAFAACAGELGHAAVLRTAARAEAGAAPDQPGPDPSFAPLSLLPVPGFAPRPERGERGRALTRGDVLRWFARDALVQAELTGRQVALLLRGYVRRSQGWSAPADQVLYPGGLTLAVPPKRTDAVWTWAATGSPLAAHAVQRVWMAEYHRLGGGGLAAQALVQPTQPYRSVDFTLAEALVGLLADPSVPLPAPCAGFLSRTPEPQRPRPARQRARPSASAQRAPRAPPASAD
jgi:2',3'-cyclic-nucleotide 2'-phosphodiesterase (5'-nucleotidase family)